MSPEVVAVGGTSLTLNADNSYASEAGWGSSSDSTGLFLGSGGGPSQYEPEPSYQYGVQSTGRRTAPDVALLADPATGAWVADPYNQADDNPWITVGGTSLSAPAWAGLLALADQGRVTAGSATLGTAGLTEAQAALYGLPRTDYHDIIDGNNGYSAGPGYDLVTGLGSPVADQLVPDLVAYSGGPASSNAVAPIAAPGLDLSAAARLSGEAIAALARAAALRVFSALPAGSARPALAVAGHSAVTVGTAGAGTLIAFAAGDRSTVAAGAGPFLVAGARGEVRVAHGSPAWLVAALDIAGPASPVAKWSVDGLRPEMPAGDGEQVLVGAAGDDLLIGGEGRNVLVGGYAAGGAGSERLEMRGKNTSHAARDLLFADALDGGANEWLRDDLSAGSEAADEPGERASCQ
jgi:hypothetical protein